MSCSTARLPEPSSLPLCQPPQSFPCPRTPTGGLGRSPIVWVVEEPSQSSWRPSSGQCGVRGECAPTDGHGAKDWVRSGSGIGSALRCLGRNLKVTDLLLTAGGDCVLQLLCPAPAPQPWGAEGTCLQVHADMFLIADGGAWLPTPAQRPWLQPVSAHPGHWHPLRSRQAVSFPFPQLPPGGRWP